MVKTTKLDVNDFLDSEERIALFLESAFEDGDPGAIASALGDVAKARGMSQIARDAKLSRESLYRSLSVRGNPELATVVKVAKSFGLRLAVEPIGKRARTRKPKRRSPIRA